MRQIRFPHALVAGALLLLTLAVSGQTQRGAPAQPQLPGSASQGASGIGQHGANDRDRDPDPGLRDMEQRQARARNDERQKKLVADTDKLLALATKLHEDVGKTDHNILSLDVVKRADEIEKLAHSVKERMKG